MASFFARLLSESYGKRVAGMGAQENMFVAVNMISTRQLIVREHFVGSLKFLSQTNTAEE
jgi:hypothetical protein